jgi:hypothetical protein
VTFERPEAWWLLAVAAPLVALHLHLRRRRLVDVSSVELWRGLADGPRPAVGSDGCATRRRWRSCSRRSSRSRARRRGR